SSGVSFETGWVGSQRVASEPAGAAPREASWAAWQGAPGGGQGGWVGVAGGGGVGLGGVGGGGFAGGGGGGGVRGVGGGGVGGRWGWGQGGWVRDWLRRYRGSDGWVGRRLGWCDWRFGGWLRGRRLRRGAVRDGGLPPFPEVLDHKVRTRPRGGNDQGPKDHA